jgi:hypothetical protein
MKSLRVSPQPYSPMRRLVDVFARWAVSGLGFHRMEHDRLRRGLAILGGLEYRPGC